MADIFCSFFSPAFAGDYHLSFRYLYDCFRVVCACFCLFLSSPVPPAADIFCPFFSYAFAGDYYLIF
jgi:hypothetical protein